MPRLFAALDLAQGDGIHAKLLRALAKVKLLILDDWGPEPLAATRAASSWKSSRTATGAGSILMTSQIPVQQWYDIIGDPTLADAILDRLIHNAYRIELTGESLRKQQPTQPNP